MFQSLSDRLQNIFSKLKGHGKLSPSDVDEAMREIRLALLEADVNFKVVKNFVNKIKERAVGAEVLESLTPSQQVIKIVNEEMTALLGSTESKLLYASQPPTVVMLVGLQGSGKTTATAKLAHLARNQGKHPLLIAADIYRPAAIDQLIALGEENNLPVYHMDEKPEKIVETGLKEATKRALDVVIVDTAGRLHIDENMMDELVRLKKLARPHQILLVVDSMTGQDAVNLAKSFQDKLDFDGIILTKLDGDARGGAALSIREVTGRPIKFISLGEKINSLEVFHPDRMASRILGMGDVLTLIEKAQAASDSQQAEELERKIRKSEFTFEDFLSQMRQLKKMGPISQIIKMLPGMPSASGMKNLNVSDKDMVRIEAIIESMTPEERIKPAIIKGSRRERIAKGSGTSVRDVNQLLAQFNQTKKMMKKMLGMSKKMGRKGTFPF